jgi:hypothetical protein
MASLKKGFSTVGSGLLSFLEVVSEGLAEANAREVRRRTVTVWSEDRDAYVEVLLDAPPIWDGDKVRFAKEDSVGSPVPRAKCNETCGSPTCIQAKNHPSRKTHPRLPGELETVLYREPLG